jgi:hypothetical protein
MATLPLGTLVTVPGSSKYTGRWRIFKVNPTRYKLRGLDAPWAGMQLTCPHSMAVACTPQGDTSQTVAGTSQTVDLLDPAVTYKSPGCFVRVKPAVLAKWPPAQRARCGGLWVVLADKGAKVNCARPGGNDGKYIRFTATSLEEVPAASVLLPEYASVL